MEKRYKSLSIFEFQEQFPDDSSCYEYLSELKWGSGFICSKCGYEKYHQGQGKYMRKCNKCHHQESPTANTLFHKVKFPILKAFYIVYYVSTSKKGIASTELSRKLDLRQKTCWSFKRKVMESMKSSGNHPLGGQVKADETFVGGKEKAKKGRSQGKKRQVLFVIETQGKGITRAYGSKIDNAGTKQLRPFIEKHVSKTAQLTTDKWRGYTPLKKEWPKLVQIPSKGGKNFDAMHRFIMNFKAWLRGMHHSVRHLQAYIDEYTYRFNRHFMKEGIFDNLMKRMVKHQPVLQRNLSA